MQKHYDTALLRTEAVKVLARRGVPEKDAAVFVDSMLSADLCGVYTHGIRMLPKYIRKIDRGDFSFASPTVVKQMPAFTIVDAQNTIGAVSAVFATDIAIAQARTCGVHTVFSRNGNTFGAAFYYAQRIAEAGMLGFVCCNAPAAMPAYHGLEAMLGTNPLAFAFPTKSYGPVSADIASSVVSKSRFATAKLNGELLEPGWALDRQGNPTTDPEEGIQGLVLPMGGFKGYCIAMGIDMISGFLSGAACLNQVGKFYSADGACMNVGQMFTAFAPELIYEGDFPAEADAYVERLRHSKTIEGQRIVIPGDNRRRQREASLQDGISLPEETWKELESLFSACSA